MSLGKILMILPAGRRCFCLGKVAFPFGGAGGGLAMADAFFAVDFVFAGALWAAETRMADKRARDRRRLSIG